jgi:hypothetical protein
MYKALGLASFLQCKAVEPTVLAICRLQLLLLLRKSYLDFIIGLLLT